MREHDRLFIGGEWTAPAGTGTIEVISPHTEEVIGRAEARDLRKALDQLPGDQLRVIKLAYYGGFTHQEIAEMLDVPLGTVKSRMRLALERIRRGLGGTEVARA